MIQFENMVYGGWEYNSAKDRKQVHYIINCMLHMCTDYIYSKYMPRLQFYSLPARQWSLFDDATS